MKMQVKNKHQNHLGNKVTRIMSIKYALMLTRKLRIFTILWDEMDKIKLPAILLSWKKVI